LPRDLSFTAQTNVPFRLNTGKFLSIVQPAIEYTYRRDIQYVEQLGSYRTDAHYFYYTLYASSYLRMSMRDILPRLGLTASGGYYHAPFNHQVTGAVLRLGLTGYVPGILKHQAIKLAVNYQKQYLVSGSHQTFINLIRLPRGQPVIFGEELTRFSVDYAFPLLYPDIELGPVLYLKRIRGTIWADHLIGKNVIMENPHATDTDKNYTTAGFDLVTDLNLFRITFPLSIGGRVTYEPETGRAGIEGIFSVEIN
jgi:hypothetical protein